MRFNKYLFAFLFTSLLWSLVCTDLHASQILSIYPKGMKPNGLIFGISLLFGLFAALAIHELGHLLVGLAQGFRFELFVVFLLGLKRTKKGIKPFLNTNLGYMGGIAATVPIIKGPENRKKFALMVAAGPLASLLYAIICLVCLVFTKNLYFTFWLVSGTVSIGLFFATTIPSKSGIFFTDRARFQRLISKGDEGKSEEALLSLIAQTTATNSCKELSLADTLILQKDKEPFMRFWGYYYAYEYFKANNDEEQSKQAMFQLFNLKETISKPVWKALNLGE
jgi:hypothetical protein